MSLEENVMADLKKAMLAKDEKSLRSLRAIKAAIILAKTAEGAGGDIKKDDEVRLLQKLIKQRKDSLEIYKSQQRADLADKEQEEITIIEKFLPQQMSAEELKSALQKIIADTGASSPAGVSTPAVSISLPSSKYFTNGLKCLRRMVEASTSAISGVVVPSVQISRINLSKSVCCPTRVFSTLYLTRLTGV